MDSIQSCIETSILDEVVQQLAPFRRIPSQIKAIVESFTVQYMWDPLVAGALFTGSYATGVRVSRYSDIDLTFVLSDSVQTHKRGSEIVAGYLVEYTACPFRYIRKLFDENRRAGVRHISRKYATGIILADRGGVVELQKEAKRLLEEPIENGYVHPQQLEMAKYYLFDQVLNVRALYEENSVGFLFAYFAHIQKILDTYGKFLGVEVLRPERLYQLLSDTDFCARYGVDQFPDSQFMSMAVACMEEVSIEDLIQLCNYVIEKMGGFCPEGWVIEENC